MFVDFSHFLKINFRRKIVEPPLFKLYEIGILELSTIYYNSSYENQKREEAVEDAFKFSELVMEKYNPDKVLDLGCGVGRFMLPFYESGVKVKGVEGSSYAVNNPIEENLDIIQYDLTKPLKLNGNFDLVICIEVLEHIPEKHSEKVVELISKSGNKAIISAAEPGQGGTYHVNEKN